MLKFSILITVLSTVGYVVGQANPIVKTTSGTLHGVSQDGGEYSNPSTAYTIY